MKFMPPLSHFIAVRNATHARVTQIAKEKELRCPEQIRLMMPKGARIGDIFSLPRALTSESPFNQPLTLTLHTHMPTEYHDHCRLRWLIAHIQEGASIWQAKRD